MSVQQNQPLTEAVFYILLSVFEPCHGYGIMQNIEELSNGRIKMAAGTLYGAITTMLERGWISSIPSEENSRKKEYQITELGKEVVKQELLRLEELVKNGNAILGGKNEKDNT